jgi:hypothetical protein
VCQRAAEITGGLATAVASGHLGLMINSKMLVNFQSLANVTNFVGDIVNDIRY